MSRSSRPTIPVEATLHIDSEGEVIWVISVIGEESRLRDVGTIRRGRILWNGKFQLEYVPLSEKGVSGVPGGVLPRGRVPALLRIVGAMQSANAVEAQYALCWAVLRRYAVEKRCFPDPPLTVRRQAYEVIERAWKRANVEGWLRRLPTGFWGDDVPAEETLWPVTKKAVWELVKSVGSQGELKMGLLAINPLGDLLDPHSGRRQGPSSADILPTKS